MKYAMISKDGYFVRSDESGLVFQREPLLHGSLPAFLLAIKPAVVRVAIHKFVDRNLDLIAQSAMADNVSVVFIDALRDYIGRLELAYEEDDLTTIKAFLPDWLAVLEV